MDHNILTDGPKPAVYFVTEGAKGGITITIADRTAPEDPRDRAVCKALLQYALKLIEEADSGTR